MLHEKLGTVGREGWGEETAGWRGTRRIWRRERGEGDGGGMGADGSGGEGAELGVGGWQVRAMRWKRMRTRGAWRGPCVVK